MARSKQIDILLAGILYNGEPLASGKVYTYYVGTTTNKTVYTDAGLSSAATNPIILDAQGKAQVYTDGSVKLRIDDSDDNTRYTLDNLYYQQSDGGIEWGGTSSGAANTFSVTITPTIAALYAGLTVRFRTHQANTSGCTLSVNGFSKTLYKLDGKALAAGDIQSASIVEAVYDSVGDRFVLLSIISTAPDTTTWSPTLTASGSMTISSQSNQHFRFKRMDRLVWVSAYATFTTGGTASTDVLVPVPSGLTPVGNDVLEARIVSDGSTVTDGTAIAQSAGTILVRKRDSTNWTLTSGNMIQINGLYYCTA